VKTTTPLLYVLKAKGLLNEEKLVYDALAMHAVAALLIYCVIKQKQIFNFCPEHKNLEHPELKTMFISSKL